MSSLNLANSNANSGRMLVSSSHGCSHASSVESSLDLHVSNPSIGSPQRAISHVGSCDSSLDLNMSDTPVLPDLQAGDTSTLDLTVSEAPSPCKVPSHLTTDILNTQPGISSSVDVVMRDTRSCAQNMPAGHVYMEPSTNPSTGRGGTDMKVADSAGIPSTNELQIPSKEVSAPTVLPGLKAGIPPDAKADLVARKPSPQPFVRPGNGLEGKTLFSFSLMGN